MEPNSQGSGLCRLAVDLNVKWHAKGSTIATNKINKTVIFMTFYQISDILALLALLALFGDDVSMTQFWHIVGTESDMAADMDGDVADNALEGW